MFRQSLQFNSATTHTQTYTILHHQTQFQRFDVVRNKEKASSCSEAQLFFYQPRNLRIAVLHDLLDLQVDFFEHWVLVTGGSSAPSAVPPFPLPARNVALKMSGQKSQQPHDYSTRCGLPCILRTFEPDALDWFRSGNMSSIIQRSKKH